MGVRSAQIRLSFDPAVRSGRPHGWRNPVVPGDHPDPTIVRVDGTFWASATSGEWSPQFPLFRTEDLVRWEPAGSIFPVQPAWAEGSFWAPELVHDEVTGCSMVFYVGRKRGGPLCIAVASAPRMGGPYTDHGPLVCEEDGSIDPCFARDEHGAPYLIWKEDGNSRGWPTPIWAQRLRGDLLGLEGEKTQLIADDQPWEGGIVEGAYVLRHAGWFYLFYAGNSCCGRECKYAEGVARSERLLGPWEKFAGNPLIGANRTWRCPGHGTAVQVGGSDGRPEQDYLLYHAYPAGGTIFVGREAVLDEIRWTAADADGRPGWPVVNGGRGPSEAGLGEVGPGEAAPKPEVDFLDDFRSAQLGASWQWPVNTYPEVAVGGGWLHLRIPEGSPMSARPVESALLAVPRPASMRYHAEVTMEVPAAGEAALWAGLTVVGDPFNTIGLGLRGRPDGEGHVLEVWQRRGAQQAVLWSGEAPAAERVWLRSGSTAAENHLEFWYSVDGERWERAGDAYDASELPAWDRGLRLGLMLEGPRGSGWRFGRFALWAG